MYDGTEPSDFSLQSSKKREHSANGRKRLIKETSKQKQQHSTQKDQKVIKTKKNAEIDSTTTDISLLREGLAEENQAYSVAVEHLTPFSSLLCKIIRRDRVEIARIAHKIDVSENTIYRWMNGISEPRSIHLKRLIEAFPSHHESLTYAIHQTFGSVPEMPAQSLHEVRKEIYQSVLEILATTADNNARFWQITQAVFDDGLRHMDTENRGLAMTFAKLMPPHDDGIHSLIEVIVRGTPPWPHSIESKAYLGSTTLAGTAAEVQRMQLWDERDTDNRVQVQIDQFERCACAMPVMRGQLIGGVLIVSSAQPGLFHDPMICQVVTEYALMMGVALADKDFYPIKLLRLRPMPDLQQQHEELALSYRDRIITYARTHGMPFRDAEAQVQYDLEREFEQRARSELEHA